MADQPNRVFVTTASRFFTRDQAYAVIGWLDGVPKVRNDAGSFTWLVNPQTWRAAQEPT